MFLNFLLTQMNQMYQLYLNFLQILLNLHYRSFLLILLYIAVIYNLTAKGMTTTGP